MILLIASGLLARSFGALLKVDLGYRVDHRIALTMHVWDLYPAPERRGPVRASASLAAPSVKSSGSLARTLEDRPQPAYYIPHRQVPFGSMTFIARTTGDPSHVVAPLHRAVWSVNSNVSFAGVETLDGLLRDTLAARRFTLALLS